MAGLYRLANGKIRRTPTGLARATPDCCCDFGCCDLCADHTPRRLNVVIDGTSIVNGCVSCDFLGSMLGPGGTFDGTYVLTKEPGGCCWQTIITTEAVSLFYGVNDCAGEADEVITEWIARLCLYEETPGSFIWAFGIEAALSGIVKALFIAMSEATATHKCLTDLPTFLNLSNGTCFGPFPYAFGPGDGGSATITYDDTIVAGC